MTQAAILSKTSHTFSSGRRLSTGAGGLTLNLWVCPLQENLRTMLVGPVQWKDRQGFSCMDTDVLSLAHRLLRVMCPSYIHKMIGNMGVNHSIRKEMYFAKAPPLTVRAVLKYYGCETQCYKHNLCNFYLRSKYAVSLHWYPIALQQLDRA